MSTLPGVGAAGPARARSAPPPAPPVPSPRALRCGALLVLCPPCFVLVGEETAPARRGQLATAAGKCEGGETTLQCAVREAAEELRRVVDPSQCTWGFSFCLLLGGRPCTVDVFVVDHEHAVRDAGLSGYHPLANVRFVSISRLTALCRRSPRCSVAEVLRIAVRRVLFR